MAGSRGMNTMSEGLQRLLGDLAFLKTLPDADLEFLIGMETNILQKLRQPMEQMMGQMNGVGGPDLTGSGSAGPMPAGPPGAGPMPGMPMGVPSNPGGGVAGLRTEPAAPNPDELRRMLANQG